MRRKHRRTTQRSSFAARWSPKPRETRRTDYLKDALAADPGYAPAHWHPGEVHYRGRWLSIDDAAAEVMHAGKVAMYRQFWRSSH